ncbi:MAG TPA: glutamate synthase central domain-containing protein, partial [Clostridiaceae bacterium]|nr:glutamate synthase central domain-containing protein [Clostridiaceae bacterium]
MSNLGLPEKQGLYNPEMEKDSCGVGFISNIKGVQSHTILTQGLQILKSLKHRGAVGADASTGDGSGILLQLPHLFFSEETGKEGFDLPEAGNYAVGMVFLPRQPNARMYCEGLLERVIREEGQLLLGWREVPVDPEACGESAKATRPVVAQVFLSRGTQDSAEFEKNLLIIRKRAEKEIATGKKPYTDSFYICSLSSRTIVYKGQIMGYKLDEFYKDLADERVVTAIALVHERYSTNTFPSWKLAQPFRQIAHNGEINTITGNRHWMNAREGVMQSELLGDDFSKILPIIEPGGSDSASLDNVLELFVSHGHTMENSLMMMIPEAWQKDTRMSMEKRNFYEYHARVMEPWDGPATIAFSDGVCVGATVDRNGLRPARYLITDDDVVIMASEIGVIDIAPERVIEKGSVEPGKMFLVDTAAGRIVPDEEIKSRASGRKPFSEWVEANRIGLADIEALYDAKKMDAHTLKKNHAVFGYTEEELTRVIAYMAENGKEPIGSMGIDIPLAILSQQPQTLYSYFKQKFAQVTNPSIDPIREERVMSLLQFIGNHGRLLDRIETERKAKYLRLEHPILSNQDLENIRNLHTRDFSPITIPTV